MTTGDPERADGHAPDLQGPVTGPCIGVCRFLRPGPAGAHCIGCAMTEADKAAFRALETDPERRAFVAAIEARQAQMGRYRHWPAAYLAKCARKGAAPPPWADDCAA